MKMAVPGKRPGKRCCVVGCRITNLNSPGTHFYYFSVKKHKNIQREKWIQAVKRVNPDGSPWQPTKNSTICSRHFIGNKKSEHPLSPSFIPTVFPLEYNRVIKPETEKINAVNRWKRSMKRLGSHKQEQLSKFGKTMLGKVNIICDDVDTIETLPKFRNKETQVDFIEDSSDVNVFFCNHYKNGTLEEAETQVSFSFKNEGCYDRCKKWLSIKVMAPIKF